MAIFLHPLVLLSFVKPPWSVNLDAGNTNFCLRIDLVNHAEIAGVFSPLYHCLQKKSQNFNRIILLYDTELIWLCHIQGSISLGDRLHEHLSVVTPQLPYGVCPLDMYFCFVKQLCRLYLIRTLNSYFYCRFSRWRCDD